MTERYSPAVRAAEDLDLLLQLVRLDTQTVVEDGDLATVAAHFQYVRDMAKALKDKASALTLHVESISREMLPTLFENAGMKSANFPGIGTVAINQRWSASMIIPDKAIQWLRYEGNGGVVRETVHHETLGAMAKDAVIAKISSALLTSSKSVQQTYAYESQK